MMKMNTLDLAPLPPHPTLAQRVRFREEHDGIARLVDALKSLLADSSYSPASEEVEGVLRAVVDVVREDPDASREFGSWGGHVLLRTLMTMEIPQSCSPDVRDAFERHAELAAEAFSECAKSCAMEGFPFPGEITASPITNPIVRISLDEEGTHVVLMREIPSLKEERGLGARANFEVGFRIWGASIVLSRWMRAGNLDASRVECCLELGAGLGLPGLTLAEMGAREVVLTDFHPRIVRNLRYNIELNGLPNPSTGQTVTCGMLDWERENEDEDDEDDDENLCKIKEGRTFDLILAADVICQVEDCHSFKNVLTRRLRRGDGQCLACLGTSRFGVAELRSILERKRSEDDVSFTVEPIDVSRFVNKKEVSEVDDDARVGPAKDFVCYRITLE